MRVGNLPMGCIGILISMRVAGFAAQCLAPASRVSLEIDLAALAEIIAACPELGR